MNEIYSRGTTLESDWIELYNPSSVNVDITNYKIYDGGGQAGTKPKKVFSPGSVITANSFFVIITDDTTESGFGLSSTGEEVWLEDANGVIIDDVTFSAMDLSQSFGRYTDGTASWQLSNFITKGLPNSITDVEVNNVVVTKYMLNQNYPNPFNPSTNITYTLPFQSNVKITIFNLIGQVVKELVNSTQQRGYHSVSFNAADLSSGIYFYKLETNNFVKVRKMVLMK